MTTSAYLDELTAKLRATVHVEAVPINPLLSILAPPAPADAAASPHAPPAPQPKRRKMNEYAAPTSPAPASFTPTDRMAALESKRLARIKTQKDEFVSKTKLKSELESKLAQNISEGSATLNMMQEKEDDVEISDKYNKLLKERKRIKSDLAAILLVEPVEWTQEETDLKAEIERDAQVKRAAAEAAAAAEREAQAKRDAAAETQIQRITPVSLADPKQIETISIQILSERFDEFLRARRARFESFEEQERKDWAKLHEHVMAEIQQRTIRMQFLGDLPDPISEISSVASTTSTKPSPIKRDASKATALAGLFATVSKNDKFAGTWSPEPLEETDERLAWFHTYVDEVCRPVGNMTSSASFTEKQVATVKRVTAEPTFNEGLCIFCANLDGPQFPLFKDGKVPLAKNVSYRSTFRAAMVGCGGKHFCHLGCAFIYAGLYADEHGIDMQLPDKLLETDRKWNWMRIKCPRCDSCFTPLSLVASGKSVLPLYPTIQSLTFDMTKYYGIQHRTDVPPAEACVFCNGDVLQEARTLIPQTNNSIVYMACGFGYAHLDCAVTQISLNQECICGKRHECTEE